MKKYIFLVAMASLFIRCNSAIAPLPATSIEGVYINQAESEFSKSFDTLTITPYDTKAATYIIVHKTAFFRISNNILQPKQHKTENSVAVLDVEHLQLFEEKKGVIYSFSNSGDEVVIGSSRYTKIK